MRNLGDPDRLVCASHRPPPSENREQVCTLVDDLPEEAYSDDESN